MVPVLAFDIETIPDIAGVRLLNDLPDSMSDSAVAQYAFDRQREKTGSDFLPHLLHRIVAISCAFRNGDGFHVRSLGTEHEAEAGLIQSFFRVIEKYTPQLVSWNGSGFDLPVLHYRSMIHRIAAPKYWDLGERAHEFKWNNYISRYHTRHIDLMDMLALYQPRANASLDALAKLCGLPGKCGMDGSQVWQSFIEGRIQAIRQYCETDVVNTYLLYCRFQLMRGHFTSETYEEEVTLVRTCTQTATRGRQLRKDGAQEAEQRCNM